MNDFIKDMIYYINGINILNIFIYFSLAALSILISVTVIRLIYDAKEFTETTVNIVLKDFKSIKNQRSKN